MRSLDFSLKKVHLCQMTDKLSVLSLNYSSMEILEMNGLWYSQKQPFTDAPQNRTTLHVFSCEFCKSFYDRSFEDNFVTLVPRSFYNLLPLFC